MQVTSNQYVGSVIRQSLATASTAATSGEDAQPPATGTTQPAAYSKAPGVSAAVSAALLQIQETGSAFNRDDTRLMHIRGVSEQDRQRFAAIVQDAAQTGGYDDPLGYVGSLSKADIGVLQRVHSLAEPRGVTGVKSEEGAFNLLLPQSLQVDTNNDAIVERGMAKGFVFPPPNSPQGVKDAWEAATADMTSSQRMMAIAPFLSLSVGANIELDDSGAVVGVHEPGEAGYKNVFGTTSAEWTAMLADMIDGSRSMEAIDPLYIERTKLLESFAANITEDV